MLSVFQYGIGHNVDFTCESRLYKPALASAREVISPDSEAVYILGSSPRPY